MATPGRSALIAQIKAIDPTWHYDEIGPADAFGKPTVSLVGLQAKVNDLRLERAAAIARVKGDYEPLQVETIRFVQRRADNAYDQGLMLQKAGRLSSGPSDRVALGNYVDQRVRGALRERYNQLGIDSAGAGPVRVNRRENNSSDLTYRQPDIRIKDIALDVTLSRKTAGTAQIKGFFGTDFQPKQVVIIRPRQVGDEHAYIIPRPEIRK